MITKLGRRAYDRMLRPFRHRLRVREQARATAELAGSRARSPAVVVLMAGGLHIARLCVSRIPEGRDLVIVSNGLAPWEVRWARQHFPARHFLEFSHPWSHAALVDLLVGALPTNFTLLDYDCFVLEPSWFDRVDIVDPGEVVRGCFPFPVADTGIELGHTFLLQLNCGRLRELRARFGIGAEEHTWDSLPAGARDAILKTGLREGCYPESDKAYFDTLRAVVLAGLGEGLKCGLPGRFPPQPVADLEVVHVGGVVPRASIYNLWLYRGAYFWRLALEACGDEELAGRYRRESAGLDQLAASHPQFAAALDPGIDALLRRLAVPARAHGR